MLFNDCLHNADSVWTGFTRPASELIAATPEIVDYLLAEVDRLRVREAEARRYVEQAREQLANLNHYACEKQKRSYLD